MLKNTSTRVRRRWTPCVIDMLLVCFLLTLNMLQAVEAAGAQSTTIVSLTFDDNWAESDAIQPLLNSGLKATFYLNSNRIRLSGPIDNTDYLTKGEIDTLFNNGYEIGGHTINHVDLATLTDAAALTAICDDLATLRGWYGDNVYSFAYPYSSTGPTTQGIVLGGCPGTYGPLNKPVGKYESARAVGGVGCQNCPVAETIPPAFPYYIASTDSVLSTTTLADMQNYVTQAETNGGGWVTLVFHSVCTGCQDYAVTQNTLTQFLTWLKAREPQGTYVRTVHQVMTGDYPPLSPPPQLGPNMLINPSLNDFLGSVPSCWERREWGNNNATWTRTTGFTGSTSDFAQQLQITSLTDGDRSLVPAEDAGQQAGGCAPSVEAGANYQLSAQYKSNTGAVVVLDYMDANGVWQYWRDGPHLPAASNWSPMTHSTGPLPTGAKAISFGITLASVGTLTTDEYSMKKVLGSSPPPNTAPTFVGGITTLTVNMNSSALDLKPNLHVSDADTGQTETWSSSVAPTHGTLTVTGATASSGSTNITPGGTITYTPASGYSGTDSFTVQVSDGSATATRTFAVNVLPTNTTPTFTGGTTTLTVNMNSPAVDLKPNLHVSDTDTGQTETWSSSAAPTHGTLTVTGATASSGSTNITPGGTITYTPASGYSGPDSFTVQVSDGSATATRTFAVTVTGTPINTAPTFVGGSTSLLVGMNSPALDLKPNLHVSDIDAGQTETWSQSTAPVHGTLAFSGATASSGSTDIISSGTISYTPVSGYSGSDSFTVQVSDGSATATRTFTVNVLPNALGPNLLINPSLNDFPGSTPTCWMHREWGTNNATWTRTTGYTGSNTDFAQQLQMTSRTNGDRSLVPTEDAGQQAGGCAPSVEAGSVYQLSAYYKSTTGAVVILDYLDANGVWQYLKDGPTLPASNGWALMTFSTGALPAGAKAISYGIVLTSVGTLTTDEYSLQKVLGISPPPNTPPTFTGGTTTLTVAINSAALDLKPNLHVSDADTGQTETWSSSVAPTHGTLTVTGATASSGSTNITPGGAITYKPVVGYSGSDSFTMQVSDGTATATRTFAVTVTPNTAPTFTGGTTTLTVAINSAALDLKPNLHVSDADTGQTETWSQSIAPLHGTLTVTGATASSGSTNITPGGTITYKPVVGYSGSDSFTVQVSDGTATATRTFAVTVTPNTAPTFTGGTTTLTVAINSAALSLKPNLRVSDIDAGQTETWSSSVAPLHGTLTVTGATASSGSTNITPGGTITYKPVVGYSGSDSFTVQVSDGTATATRTFAVTVTPNTAPTFTGGTTTLTVAINSAALSLKPNLRVSDIDAGQTETWSSSVAPLHGTLTVTGATASSGSTNITPGGTITYKPVTGYTGSDSFTVQVSDGSATATRTFAVTVQ
ncbi:tandem-95 repeat protein [Methylobacter sp.]|uniref:tandem-95 repeat protein n=1 Tax=Methylobacter sp. TaxID=2051955 RepID=UPI002FDD50D3